MVKIQCDNCERIVEVGKGWDTSATCNKCGGSFSELDEESYEEDSSEDEDEEDSNEGELCHICGKTLLECDNYVSFKYGEGDLFENYNEITICKKCIDKVYPRRIETIVKEIPKIIYKNSPGEVQNHIDFEGKTKFD